MARPAAVADASTAVFQRMGEPSSTPREDRPECGPEDVCQQALRYGTAADATGGRGDVSTHKGMAEWGYELFMERYRERRYGLAREGDAGKGVLPGGFEPCLVTLFRLLASRDADGAREPVPLWHLRALARTGHLARAAELAFTISAEPKQGEALLALVEEAAGAGDLLGA